MALDLNRRVKDAFSRDEEYKERPEAILRELHKVIDRLTPPERMHELEHLKAYSTVYFQGRHNMDTPRAFSAEMAATVKRAERLSAVEKAREMVEQFGGPPSKSTIQQALERSVEEREIRRQSLPSNGFGIGT